LKPLAAKPSTKAPSPAAKPAARQAAITAPPDDRARERRRAGRLAALFLVGVTAWCGPLVHVASRRETLFGLPLVFLYLFASWATLIVLLARVLREPREPRAD
jgi:hypothetical protein